MVLGVVVAVNSASGKHLTFQYELPDSQAEAAAPGPRPAPVHVYAAERIRKEASSASLAGAGNMAFGLSQSSLGKLLADGDPLNQDRVLQVEVGGLCFLGYPFNPVKSGEITLFNACFVLPRDCEHLPMWRAVVTRLSLALVEEEERCGYVGAEVTAMSQAVEMVRASERLSPACMESVLSASDLARTLRRVVLELGQHGSAYVLLNKWLPLRFILRDPSVHPLFPVRPYHALLLVNCDRKSLRASLPADASAQLKTMLEHASPDRCFEEVAAVTGIPFAHVAAMAAHLAYWGKAKIIVALAKQNVYVAAASGPAVTPKLVDEFRLRFEDKGLALSEALSRFSVQRPLRTHLQRQSDEGRSTVAEVLVWLLQHDLVEQIFTFYHFLPPAVELGAGAAPGSSGGEPSGADRAGRLTAAAVTGADGGATDGGERPASSVAVNAGDGPDAGTSAGSKAAAAAAGSRGAYSPRGGGGGGDEEEEEEEDQLAAQGSPQTAWGGAEAGRPRNDLYDLRTRTFLAGPARSRKHFATFERLVPYLRGYLSTEEIRWREHLTDRELHDVLVEFEDVVVAVEHEQFEPDMWAT